jgi:hypothetical protein
MNGFSLKVKLRKIPVFFKRQVLKYTDKWGEFEIEGVVVRP